jgi:hypothetical protein
MNVSTSVDLNLKGLEKLRSEIGGAYRARVGIIGSKATQEHTVESNSSRPLRKGEFRAKQGGTLSNAEIGVIQMFGSITNKIPPRDFLFMPIQSHAKEIIKDMQSLVVKKAVMAGEYKKVYGLLGAAALKWVLEAFATRGFGQWAPNAPSTVDQKGSGAPLIDTGQLRRACAFDVVGKGKA